MILEKLKYKTIKTALKFVGITLNDNGCKQLLVICTEIQKLINIIKTQ